LDFANEISKNKIKIITIIEKLLYDFKHKNKATTNAVAVIIITQILTTP
jgi:hypothetical protein